MALKLTVNGEVRCLDPEPMPPTLEAVIAALGHNPQLVVAEHQRAQVVRHARREDQQGHEAELEAGVLEPAVV